jgi:catechol 2,3-dioxygenase-like lactoylglutathione lyase family enzyme
MSGATLQHVNVTVSDAGETAALLCNLFEWQIRWRGDSNNGGRTVHVGSNGSYVALFSPRGKSSGNGSSQEEIGGLNHIAVVVKDLDAVEKRVKSAGFTPRKRRGSRPGRRFYFHDRDNIEYEVVSYEDDES